jgi:hypothetical protein
VADKRDFLPSNRSKTPHIKEKKCTKKNYTPAATNFQLKKKEKRKKRKKGEGRTKTRCRARPIETLCWVLSAVGL